MDAGQVIKEKGHEWFPPFKPRKIDQAEGKKLLKPHGSLEEIATMAEKAQVTILSLQH